MSRMERLREWVVEKLNPAQIRISEAEGSAVGSTQPISYRYYFRDIDCVLPTLLPSPSLMRC